MNLLGDPIVDVADVAYVLDTNHYLGAAQQCVRCGEVESRQSTRHE